MFLLSKTFLNCFNLATLYNTLFVECVKESSTAEGFPSGAKDKNLVGGEGEKVHLAVAKKSEGGVTIEMMIRMEW